MKEFVGLFFLSLVLWLGILLFFGQFILEGTIGLVLLPVLVVSVLGKVMMDQDKRIDELERQMKRLTWTEKNDE